MKWLFGAVARLVRWILRTEFLTEVGRYNLVGTLVLLILTALLVVANGAIDIIRLLVAIFRPEVASAGVDWSWIFIVFAVLMGICVLMLGVYEILARAGSGGRPR